MTNRAILGSSESRISGFNATPAGVKEAIAQSSNAAGGTDRLTAMKAAFSVSPRLPIF